MDARRATFAHEAVLAMAPEEDERAPGGAITVALCGSWTHDPPCPLAPHHTRAERYGAQVRLRILFAAEPGAEPRVRALVREALVAGAANRPDGAAVYWHLISEGPSAVRDEERVHAARLAES